MNKKYYIKKWEVWVELCEDADLDPHDTTDFGRDLGGGECVEFIYSGEYPEEKYNERAK